MIIDVVVSFGGGEGFGEVSTGVEVPIGILLHEYTTGGSEGGVGHDKEGLVVVWEGEDRLFKECLLYFLEGDFVVH